MRVFTVPFSTMAATSSAFSSVTRRPAHEARLAAERPGEPARLRAAAVHQHDADADLVEDLHLLRAGSRTAPSRSRAPRRRP